jgi:polar amino acid transport system substrate-binding protein
MSLFKSISRRDFGSLTLAGLAAASLGIVPAQAATPDEIKARGKLTVGVMTDYPPFGGIDAQQHPEGYDADVAKLLADSLGVKLELVPVTGPNRIPYLLTNKVDVLIATLGITAPRLKQVLFSNPYSTLTIYVLAPKSVDIKTPEDLKSVTISVSRASTELAALEAIAPKGTPLKIYDDDATSIQALISGQTQALGASTVVLAHLIKNFPQLNIEPKILLNEQANGMAIRKSDTALLDYANKFIAQIVENGELSKINEKWFGFPLKSLPPMPKF